MSWQQAQAELVTLSLWIDTSYPAELTPESNGWRRIAKVCEEAGEVVAAYAGSMGENPRKGVTHTPGDVDSELLDVAVAALGALEHRRGHLGDSLQLLENHIAAVAARAGLL